MEQREIQLNRNVLCVAPARGASVRPFFAFLIAELCMRHAALCVSVIVVFGYNVFVCMLKKICWSSWLSSLCNIIHWHEQHLVYIEMLWLGEKGVVSGNGVVLLSTLWYVFRWSVSRDQGSALMARVRAATISGLCFRASTLCTSHLGYLLCNGWLICDIIMEIILERKSRFRSEQTILISNCSVLNLLQIYRPAGRNGGHTMVYPVS